MVTKIIFLAASVLIVLSKIFPWFQDPDQLQRVLDATVMITITVPELDAGPEIDEALPIPPDEYRSIARADSYIMAEGLGTLVNQAGDLLIITHDHWSVLDGQLGTVQIRDGRGQLLVELELLRFKKLIQYRDGGTMILTAPKGIAAGKQSDQTDIPAYSPEKPELTAGDVVSLAYRERNGQVGVFVMQAIVESIGEKHGKPVMRLRSSDGMPTIGGDSGGGVWLQGEVVANMWTTVMMEDIQTGERRPTHTSIAALMSFELAGL
jgi:hypothetical protein